MNHANAKKVIASAQYGAAPWNLVVQQTSKNVIIPSPNTLKNSLYAFIVIYYLNDVADYVNNKGVIVPIIHRIVLSILSFFPLSPNFALKWLRTLLLWYYLLPKF